MPRFFRRLAEGVFDEEDVKRRADELADFVAEARAAYGLGELTAVGFSNGANIAAAMLLRRPESLAGGALLRAMVPLSERPEVDLRGQADPASLGRGRSDHPAREFAARLATHLSRGGGGRRGADPAGGARPDAAGRQPDAELACERRRLSRGNYNGMLSCFFHGRSTSLARSMASARAIRRRVECGMITSSI